MNRVPSALITGLFAACASIASGQTPPSPEEILSAWLTSPHANSQSEAFRHWDTEGEIPGNCAVCHSTTGVVDYLASFPTIAGVIDHPVPIGTTVECAACHNPGADALREVLFPSGQTIAMADGSAICTVCHQGRTSADTVAAALGGRAEDEVSADIAFINIHYAAAASTQLGSVVRGGFEYAGQDYAGAFAHVEGLNTCVSCHDAHETKVELSACTSCHQGVSDFRAIRTTPTDVLGTGDISSGIAIVIDDLHARLEAAIMAYASGVGSAPIIYADHAYPYFFNDLNADGAVTEGEAAYPNRYQSWTPRLLRAAYNYQFVSKDRGAFAHNPHYAMQLLIDSITDLAEVAPVDVTGLVRP
ncbi:cytochrome c3 family protein [Salipiger sp. 1_MG-2023]|uniref:cytochrome c3 family protein n=1 Tax=Salipiger sp. 1_MG-2023 TaxID=3062665 RepID=UPI0026E16A47|nr:cytochrome c3 family protein [Salipiger sp. 1_MG-2023]MDO6587833.1 cytochrome c3 family protein [Salipiger sp. 1_MG-2023]